MERVETDESRLAHLPASQQDPLHRRADPRDVVQQVRRDADRPEGELVPRQQVAGEGKPQGDQEQPEPDRPVEFPSEVRAREDDPEQVQKGREHHGVACPAVQGPDKGAEGHGVLKVLCAFVRFAGVGNIVDHQQNTAQGQQEEQGEGHDPQPESRLWLHRPGRNPQRVQVEDEVPAHGMRERFVFQMGAGAHAAPQVGRKSRHIGQQR